MLLPIIVTDLIVNERPPLEDFEKYHTALPSIQLEKSIEDE